MNSDGESPVVSSAQKKPRCLPGYSPQKPSTSTILYTVLKSFNNVCELIAEYDDAICVSTALFSSLKNVACTAPCMCDVSRKCSHLSQKFSGESGKKRTLSLNTPDEDNISHFLNSISVSKDMLFFVFSAHVLRAELTWKMITENKFKSILHVLMALDMKRTMLIFERNYDGWCREIFQKKKMKSFIETLDELRFAHLRKSNDAEEGSVASLSDSDSCSSYTLTVSDLIHMCLDFTAGKGAYYANLLSKFFIEKLCVGAPIGNPRIHPNTRCLAHLFSKKYAKRPFLPPLQTQGSSRPIIRRVLFNEERESPFLATPVERLDFSIDNFQKTAYTYVFK